MKHFTTPLSQSDLREIVECLHNDGIVIIPTDTVYGIAALPDHPNAINRIISMKGRDSKKPLQLLSSGLNDSLRSSLHITNAIEKVASKFWPGALTIVIDAVNGSTEGVRVPDHDTIISLCEAAGGSLTCTSANIAGEPPALTPDDAIKSIPHADMIVEDGHVKGGSSSTVVKISKNDEITILREGPISLAEIISAINN